MFKGLLLIIQLSSAANFYGDPIEVSASFSIFEDKDQRASQDMETQSSFYSFQKTRPRPYLNNNGQIEFLPQTTTTTPNPFKRKTTFSTRYAHLFDEHIKRNFLSTAGGISRLRLEVPNPLQIH